MKVLPAINRLCAFNSFVGDLSYYWSTSLRICGSREDPWALPKSFQINEHTLFF